MRAAGMSLPRVVLCGLALVVALTACGSAPPDATSLLNQSSQRMLRLKGFHFQMQIAGFTGTGEPVQSAQGDAHPPDLHARVNLKEGAILLEVEVVFAAGKIYLKSFTGGWQELTADQVSEFFDARTLFDAQTGLFAAMRDTTTPTRGNSEKIGGHDTYPVDGRVAAARVHQLLTLIRDQGSYQATYWIDSQGSNLWRARLTGNLFDPSNRATITFDFSNHDHPVSVTPPPLG
jgi:lipoprotein LprG